MQINEEKLMNDKNEPVHRLYLTLASILLNILPGSFTEAFHLILTSTLIRIYFFSDTRNIVTSTKQDVSFRLTFMLIRPLKKNVGEFCCLPVFTVTAGDGV